jgi:carboxynorspermidine decarboxylase
MQRQKAMLPPTPYYLIDERRLLRNLKKIKYVREVSGARSLLALKCFSTWAVFGLMRRYMDGTTSSSLYETRLGFEEFGKETHAYCVGWSREDIRAVKRYADTIIFNSISQLRRFHNEVRSLKIGLRVNPGISYSHFDLADPARRYSRLGVTDRKALRDIMPLISGVMFHFNCENDDVGSFCRMLERVGRDYGDLLAKLEWISLGGGVYFTKDGYPLDTYCRALKKFSERFGVQIYLEPGETAITRSAELVTSVVDIVHNEVDIAIVDASTEGHMLDLLIYRTSAKMDNAERGRFTYMVAGRSCLAGDVFGTYRLRSPLKIGSVIRFADAAGYSMVKKNWFNGLQMPSIAVKRLGGSLEVLRSFGYREFKNNLS